jgi:protein-S-isoprenylcysteine O-methyltransferase Ste14
MPTPGAAILTLWFVWLVTWWAAAAWSAPARVRQSARDRLSHNVLTWGGALCFVAQAAWLSPLFRPLVFEPRWLSWGAVAVAALGFAWMWWARWHIGRLWSGAVTLKTGHRVVQSGPYRFTRHPIYSGLLLAIVATTIVRDAWMGVLGLALFTTGILLKIRQEERLLMSHLGADYEAYRSRVPMLIPRFW